jgi:hypothetical protein
MLLSLVIDEKLLLYLPGMYDVLVEAPHWFHILINNHIYRAWTI